MATPLFITTEDVVKYTALNGNTDTDKYIQFCLIAQEIHVQNYLGTDLYDKIAADIVASTLAGNYLSLVTDYIKPMLIHFAMMEYLPFSAYTIANKGVYKHSSENSINVEKNEIDFLIEKERDIAEHYVQRFIKYICNNTTLFPEYSTNTGEDMRPDKNAVFSGWMLDNNSDRDRYDYENLEL